MKNSGTVRLETERLVLRPFAAEDADAMYRNWASDSQVTKFLFWEPHKDVDETRGILEGWIQFCVPDLCTNLPQRAEPELGWIVLVCSYLFTSPLNFEEYAENNPKKEAHLCKNCTICTKKCKHC